MKKNLFFITCFFLGLFSYKSYAQKYDEADKEGLRKFLRQGSINGLGKKYYNFELVGLTSNDTLLWKTTEEWIPKINTESRFICKWKDKRLVDLSIISRYYPYGEIGAFTGNLDCSNFTELQKLYGFCIKIDSLNISKNSKLTHLTWISISGNQHEIDFSRNPQLTYLNIDSGIKRGKLDVSKNSKLQSLTCNTLGLVELDLSNNTELTYLDCSFNYLSQILLPKNSKIDYINCQYNNFQISALPRIQAKERYYGLQQPTYIKEVKHTQTIDLSSEYYIEGYISSYNWYVRDGKEYKPINLTQKPEGVFLLNKEYIGKEIHCVIKNEYFPTITGSYQIEKVIEGESLTSNILLRTSEENLHQINIGETFKINASISPETKNIQIGLFSTDGISLLENVTQSQTNNIFTCKVPENINNGNYILQPYLKDNTGKILIIEREPGAFIIDKLPISVTGNDIWSKTVISEDLILSSHLQLKASQPNKYEIEKDTGFMVYALQPSPDTRIGLFTTNGVLVEDIVISRKNNTFNCIISQYVPEAKYIIAPYEKTEGKIKIIERISGNSVIDKLPLTVTEGDIWSFKTIQETESNTDLVIYPNPVIDILKVQTNEPVENIELYTLEGLLVKSITFQSQLNIQDLSSGIYIVKIKSGSKVKTTKIFKK